MAKTAGWADLLTQVLVARDILLQAGQGVGAQAQAGEPDEFKLQQQARAGLGLPALQALQNHAADPAAAVVLEADHGIDQAAFHGAVVQASDAVPAPAALAPAVGAWIDQVRELVSFVVQTAQLGGRKVVLLERMVNMSWIIGEALLRKPQSACRSL